MEITVTFAIYKEPTIASRLLTKSVIAYGISPSMQSVTEEYIDFENLTYTFDGINYPILTMMDAPYRYVLKTKTYDIPSISKHIIAFAVNRLSPFSDVYNLKINKPKTFSTSSESSFEITGVFLDEFTLQRSFNNIPNDLIDYEQEPSEEPVYDDYTNLTRLNYEE